MAPQGERIGRGGKSLLFLPKAEALFMHGDSLFTLTQERVRAPFLQRNRVRRPQVCDKHFANEF